jgi:tRNA (adenine37-N6)-methyltransferase
VGVFASRAPNRPNGLGLSLLRLLAIEPGALRVASPDAVDGTPVYDVKPYLPWAEALPEARADWAAAPPARRDEAALRVAAEVVAVLPAPVLELARQVLALELAPAYQAETASAGAGSGREYGITLAGWNLRWRETEGGGRELFSARAR